MIPKFAIIGEPNEGKSTLVATLAEDDTAKIGPIAGTTIRRATYKAGVGDELLMEFTDTPGFQNTPEIEYWFEHQPKHATDLPEKFVKEHQYDRKFAHDCEIMKALSGHDIAMLYVVDGTKPIRDEDRSQISFLPRCSPRRMAVINLKSDEKRYLEDWKKLIGTAFGSYKEFNARNAKFEDRMGLLKDLSSVIQDWKEPMSRVIKLYESDWQDRIAKSASALMRMIEDTLSAQASTPSPKFTSERLAAERTIRTQLEKKVRDFESRFQRSILNEFHHDKPLWSHEDAQIIESDIFSEEAWRFLGLSKEKMLVAGAITGAIAGGAIDAAVGGASFMLGTLIGAAAGVVGSWMSAGKAIQISANTFLGRLTFQTRHDLIAKVEVQSKLIWVMVDRALVFVDLTSKWSHGDRAYADAQSSTSTSTCFTNHWTKEERTVLTEWLGHLGKSRKDADKLRLLEQRVFQLLTTKLDAVTRSSNGS